MAHVKKIKVEEAVGTIIVHDITEVRLNREFKGRAFKKGHKITSEDIPALLRLGKENLYVLEIDDDELHENDAAVRLARGIAGKGIYFTDEVSEGKITFYARYDGLLQVESDALEQLNLLGEVMCATRHTNTLVKKNDMVAGTRAIPLIIKTRVVEEAERICAQAGTIIQALPLQSLKVGLLITGNEVYKGRIQDGFEPIIRKKIKKIGCQVIKVIIAPDDEEMIADSIRDLLDAGAQVIITTGGMSVDPDDVTRQGIKKAGAKIEAYGSPVLPGAMFLVSYINGIPILGVPAAALYYTITIFDLILPRIVAGERIGRAEIAKLGHGGFCIDCRKCIYPLCYFGKGS
ncbi:MAG: molybdopterin-binding protein [Deltaproteobacteria bacterium]|nr:molybdopterin-binding protein [Deltaproteobacteria bacterium]